jgi:hypothetical protein
MMHKIGDLNYAAMTAIVLWPIASGGYDTAIGPEWELSRRANASS